MSNDNVEQHPDDSDKYRLTPNGAMKAVEAMMLFEQGYDHAEIEQELELPKVDGEPAGTSVRILIAMADLTGLLDDPVVQSIMQQWREELGQDEII